MLSVLKLITFKYVQFWFRNCPEFMPPEAFIKSIQNDTPVELEFPNKLGPKNGKYPNICVFIWIFLLQKYTII